MRRCPVLLGVCLLFSASLAALPRRAFTKDGLCPKGWWRRYFQCYGIFPQATFPEMGTSCRSQSGYLASLETDEEKDFITLLLQDNSVLEVGISLLKMTADGSLIWGDGSGLDFSRWFSGSEPIADMTCFKLKTDGQWHEAPCTDQVQFVCEKPILSGRVCDIDGEFEI